MIVETMQIGNATIRVHDDCFKKTKEEMLQREKRRKPRKRYRLDKQRRDKRCFIKLQRH